MPLLDEAQALESELLSRLQKTSISHGLLAPGDRVMVCLSGGKDSYTMLHLLVRLKKRLPFPIEYTHLERLSVVAEVELGRSILFHGLRHDRHGDDAPGSTVFAEMVLVG